MTKNLVITILFIMMQKIDLCNKDLIAVSLQCCLVRTET